VCENVLNADTPSLRPLVAVVGRLLLLTRLDARIVDLITLKVSAVDSNQTMIETQLNNSIIEINEKKKDNICYSIPNYIVLMFITNIN